MSMVVWKITTAETAGRMSAQEKHNDKPPATTSDSDSHATQPMDDHDENDSEGTEELGQERLDKHYGGSPSTRWSPSKRHDTTVLPRLRSAYVPGENAEFQVFLGDIMV